MDEIGDEVNDTSGNDKTVKEPHELTSESDEPNEFDDIIPETFSETDEFDDIIPETFSETDEFDDIIPETFSETDEFDDIIPETFSEPDEFDDDIPETFSEPDEFDDDIPETFSEPDEFDDDIPETFSEADEFDDILDDTIQDKEDGERADEDLDSGDVGNVIENENIGSQSTSTVLTSEIEEIESNMEHQEQEEEIEIRPEEYQGDTVPIVNTDESEFIKDVEELAEYARETKGEDDSAEPQAEQENAAYYAEQYYEKIKEKEAINEHNNKEDQETEELMQEVAEEFKDDQESGYKSDEIEKKDISNASKEITSTEEFEYLWEVRDKLDQEGKTSEEIEEVMHEAEEMYEMLKNAEKFYEEQELEKLKLVDHEDEASEEDQKEDLDREDLIEQAVELEEKLVEQGESQEEIDARIEESIETTEFEEKLEKVIEKQELEKLKLVDHEDEASEEDLKEELDRVDLVEQAVELEEGLVQQGKMQEEIDVSVEEAIEETIETAEFEEKVEKLIEKQELEKLKLVDHEDEATEEDQKEVLDRVDIVEQAIELEEKLYQQGRSQEEIDARVEESIETTNSEENLEEIIELEQESIVNKKLKKHDLEINEQISNESVENEENLEVLKPELDAMESESDEEEDERLQELYRQETNRRPIYARKKTKSYSQWLEQRELGAEKIKNSKSESEKIKEIEEKDWKTTLKQWIKEASEEVCNAEFKSELKKVLERKEFEDLIRKYYELDEKSQYEKLSEKEKNRLKSLRERVQKLDSIQLELLLSVFIIKKYITEHYKDDFWNSPRVNRALSEFFKHISQKYKNLKKAQENKENSKEIIGNWIEQASEGEINPDLKVKLKEIVENKENLEVLKLELDAIEIESEDKKDFLEEITKLINEELDEEDWKTTLKQWIRKASEEVCNAELKSELKKALESYDEFEDLTRKFLELYEKSQHEKLSEKENNRLKSLIERLQELDPIQLELLANIRAFKDYFNNNLWQLMNRFFVYRVGSNFFKHISQKYKYLKKTQENKENVLLELVEFKNIDEKLEIKESQTFMTQISDDILKNKILEIAQEFKEFSYKELLNINSKNFLSLKSLHIYDTLIDHYKSEKGTNRLILLKGYLFANPFKRWIYELGTPTTEVIDNIEKNLEILKYVVYTLLEGSKNEGAKFMISNLSKFIGVDHNMIRNTAKLMGNLNVIDYKRSYGIESINLQDVTMCSIGTQYHLSIQYLLTKYFKIVFRKKIYSEPYILKPISLDHPDLLIILNNMDKIFQNYFRNEFDKKNISLISFRDYKFIIVDFTTLISTSNIRDKIEKYFPPSNVLFLIVGMGLDDDILHEYKNVIIPYNVKIIKPEFFCKLIQLDLPKNKHFLMSFNDILKDVKEKNIEGLKVINKIIKTDLYRTSDLEKKLGVGSLSKIFNITDTTPELSKLYFEKIINKIKIYGNSLNLPRECIETAKNLIIKAKKLDIVRINYELISYVGAALYLSSRFLVRKNSLTQGIISDNLKMSTTPLKARMSELSQWDEIILDVLFNASINQILRILQITTSHCKELAMVVIKLVYEKIYKVQEKENAHKEPIVISATAIYLAANKLGIRLTQKKISNLIGFTKSAIYHTLLEFKVIEDEFKKLNIKIVDPIGTKRFKNSKKVDDRIIEVLKENRELSTKEILTKLNESASKERSFYEHLNNMAEHDILRKKLVRIGSITQAKWKIKEFKDEILENLEKERNLNTYQLLSKLNLYLSKKGYLEECLNKLVEDGIIKNDNNSWTLIRLKSIDEEITDLLKKRGKLNTLQIISKLKRYSPNTLRPHLNNLAKLGIIRKDQRREGKITLNYWECLSD